MVEAGLQSVFRLTGSAEVELRPIEPIKLLEVNTNTVASGVLPVQFGPAPASGIPYPSIIVEVSPEEFEKIKTKELMLPKGWQVGEEMPKPADAPGGLDGDSRTLGERVRQASACRLPELAGDRV